ncbi:hypothetical protein ACFLU5_04835 [Bacteroidota bacterium]
MRILKAIISAICILICPIINNLRAQDVRITQIEFHEGDIVILYDLLDEDINRRYTLHLYSSADNYIKPLEHVEGDIGVDIEVGGNKKVIWHVAEEYGQDYTGKISLELKGQVYIPFITLDEFEDYKSFVRGKSYEIVWAGGRGDHVLVFDLYRGEDKIHTIPNVANVGHYSLLIPKKTKPGKSYTLKVSDAKNSDDVIWTGDFKIRRKVPLGIQMFAGAAILSGISLLLQQDAGPEEIPDPMMPERE